ncbi:MAG TPA: methionine--tRNA ligase [Patescibacteria group bacterium]|nr:methionine--tRNA ligase [Patescibacteria group bacterium]
MENNKFYITTTLPYVNADPHIGFALEIIQADVIARYHANKGDEVFFNTGTDEHGQKIYLGALAEGKNPKDYCDFYAAKFDELKKALNLSYNNFIRTTDPHHMKAAQDFWNRCEKNGDIYKANYKTKYCVGCELEKQDSELVDGCCPLHPSKPLEIRDEENYFFKFSNYQDKLLKLYNDNSEFVKPAHRQKEIYNFVKEGLKDFSISRLSEKMPWGISVPGDEKHVMYVWFDALVNYVSCLGWPEDNSKFEDFWGIIEKPNAIQVAGKDNLRQQSAMWQAMLISAGLPNSKQIFIHGFINAAGGVKMSKSLGNTISPFDVVDKFGTDALRYFVLACIAPDEDSEVSEELIEERYNSDLANALGNLVSRVTNIAEKNDIIFKNSGSDEVDVSEELNDYKFNKALEKIWALVHGANKYIDDEKPWMIKDDTERVSSVINKLLNDIMVIGQSLEPFLPETSEKILNIFKQEKIVKAEPLFPKKEK